MKVWVLKAIVQKIVSFLPFRDNINYIFQKYVTKGVDLTDYYFFDRMVHAKAHIEGYAKYAKKPRPDSYLELGTGWYPVVPVSMFLVGVPVIYSVDISELITKDRLHRTLVKFTETYTANKLSDYIPFQEEKYKILENLLANWEQTALATILKQLNITYLLEDARSLSLPDSSVDLVSSNNTFEHIYPGILYPIVKDLMRVVSKSTGIMSHFVDMSDHFAHFDRSISIYNFLQFSDKQWAWIDNSIQPQSRLRFDDYLHMFKSLGVPITESTCWEGDVNLLTPLHLATQYRNIPLDRLAISHCHLVSVVGEELK